MNIKIGVVNHTFTIGEYASNGRILQHSCYYFDPWADELKEYLLKIQTSSLRSVYSNMGISKHWSNIIQIQ
jgi:hypothetical protein